MIFPYMTSLSLKYQNVRPTFTNSWYLSNGLVHYGIKPWKLERRFNDKLVIQLSDPNLDTFQAPISINSYPTS